MAKDCADGRSIEPMTNPTKPSNSSSAMTQLPSPKRRKSVATSTAIGGRRRRGRKWPPSAERRRVRFGSRSISTWSSLGDLIHTKLYFINSFEFISIYFNSFQFISIYFNSFQFILNHFNSFQFISIHFNSFQFILNHFNSFQFILIHFNLF